MGRVHGGSLVYFEERFLSGNMGAFLLLVLLTWTAQQSLCKPTVITGEALKAGLIPKVCRKSPATPGYPEFCKRFIKRGGGDYSEQIFVEEEECCPVSEGCPTSIPLCSQTGGEDYSEQIIQEETTCCIPGVSHVHSLVFTNGGRRLQRT